MNAPIPVLRLRLPSAEELLPFLRRIDDVQIYSNYGPLAGEFTSGLAARFRGRQGTTGATLTSSGTTAVELALRVSARPGRRYCLMPAYTFVASAHAVANAGLEPYLVEVDDRSLSLTPAIAAEALRGMREMPAAVLVVSPFGAPPDLSVWETFEQQTEIPVVLDAAAAAASIREVNRQPQCISLHATKVLGIGEGGAILCTDADLIARTTAMTGFGFAEDRVSRMRGGNYRLSEYAAAIGLAALAKLDRTVEVLRDRTATYAALLRNSGLRLQDGVGVDWVTHTFNVIAPHESALEIKRRLTERQIGWRHWWGMGCHAHPAFADLPRTDLSATDALAPRVIGVPMYGELKRHQIEFVCETLG